MAPPPYNVAVIGYGMSAKVFHIPLVEALPESFTLYGIVQRTPKPNDDASKDHTEIKLWNSSDAMLQDPAVDIVVISSIPSAHFSQAKAALEAGKHVIVEKPFCPTSSEASELVQIATASKKLLTVYQNRRWDLDFLTLKQVLAEGHLGEIAEFETHYDRYRPQLPVASERTWKNRDLPAGGSLFDLGSHLLDQVYHLFGAPQSVTGFVGVQKRGLTDCAPDFCTVLLEYAEEKGKPSFVTVKSSSLSTEEEQLRFWVRGSKGSFKKFHLDTQEDQLKGGMKVGDNGFGYEPESHYATLIVADSNGGFKKQTYPSVEPALYTEFYKLFAKALQGKGKVPVQPKDAAQVLKIIELAQESSETGKRVMW